MLLIIPVFPDTNTTILVVDEDCLHVNAGDSV